jgi:tetratricopeptide (TPR) repeat protein
VSAVVDWLIQLVTSGAIVIVLIYLIAPFLHFVQMWQGRRRIQRRIAAGKLNPRGFQTRLELGETYLNSKMWRRAEAELAEAHAIETEHAHARSLYGRALFHLKKHPEAIQHLEKALEIRPEEGYGRTQVLLGRSYEAIGDPVRAERWYRAAIDRNSSISEPGYRLALLLQKQGDREGYREELRKSIERFSSHDRANYWRNLSYVLRARFRLLLGV